MNRYKLSSYITSDSFINRPNIFEKIYNGFVNFLQKVICLISDVGKKQKQGRVFVFIYSTTVLIYSRRRL